MAKMERMREMVHGRLDLENLQEKSAAGWRLVGLEWERETADERPQPKLEEPPFGLRVAEDCFHLEENPSEMEVLQAMMELIVQDISLPRMAEELNRRGFETRNGKPWDSLSVFNIFPRLIDQTPRIFSGPPWQDRRRELQRVAWNS